jgi:hypothetical protein
MSSYLATAESKEPKATASRVAHKTRQWTKLMSDDKSKAESQFNWEAVKKNLSKG